MKPAKRKRRKKRPKSQQAPKETTLDAAFSAFVKARDGYQCQVCGADLSGGGAECSHHVGRRKRSVRWMPDNASTKCHKCHREMDLDPLRHVEWIQGWLGGERYEKLKEQSKQLGKFTPLEKWELLEALNEGRKRYE